VLSTHILFPNCFDVGKIFLQILSGATLSARDNVFFDA